MQAQAILTLKMSKEWSGSKQTARNCQQRQSETTAKDIRN